MPCTCLAYEDGEVEQAREGPVAGGGEAGRLVAAQQRRQVLGERRLLLLHGEGRLQQKSDDNDDDDEDKVVAMHGWFAKYNVRLEIRWRKRQMMANDVLAASA